MFNVGKYWFVWCRMGGLVGFAVLCGCGVCFVLFLFLFFFVGGGGVVNKMLGGWGGLCCIFYVIFTQCFYL